MDANDNYDGHDDSDYDEGLYFLHPAVYIIVKVLQWLSAQQLMNETNTKSVVIELSICSGSIFYNHVAIIKHQCFPLNGDYIVNTLRYVGQINHVKLVK
jgi:hypothetical protein